MKNMKKLVSMLLVAVMVMAMGISAFAAPSTQKLTINGVTGHRYEVYQMIVGEVSGLNANGAGTGTLANTDAGLNLDGTVAAFEAAIAGKSGTDLSKAAMGFIKGDAYETVDGNSNEASVLNNVPSGYYVVKDVYKDNGDDCAAYMIAVVGDTTMNPKTDTPSIDKNIIDTDANAALEGTASASKKTDTAAIGDTINYELTSAVPNTEGYKWYYYVVNDTLSKGLTLVQNSFVVEINGTEIPAAEYAVYVTTTEDETSTVTETSFQLAILDMKQYPAGAPISIKYNATVNKDAEIGLDPNTNTVTLSYTNNPESTFDKDKDDDDDKPGTPKNPGDANGITPERVTKTYVTELSIYKVDENNAVLDGAEFTLTGANLNQVKLTAETAFVEAATAGTGEYYLLKDGKYTTTAPSAAEEGEEGYNADKYATGTADYNLVTTLKTTTTDASAKTVVAKLENGTFTISGLNAGDYTLTETKTPVGYNTVDPIKFAITASTNDASAEQGGSIIWGSTNPKVGLNATTGTFDTTVINVKGNLLPSTGGIGTTIFYVLGTILVMGAGVLLVTKKRMAR